MHGNRERDLRPAIVGLGFTSVVTQTVLLREFLTVFTGNELVIGIVLANWMILTGLGAMLGRVIKEGVDRYIAIGFVILAVVPLVTVFLLDYLRNIVFPVGGMIGIGESIYSAFILLFPYCLLAGSLFTVLVSGVGKSIPPMSIAGVYALEALGSVAGGILFNLLAIPVLSTFQALLLLGICTLGIAVSLIDGPLWHPKRACAVLLACGLLGAAVFLDLDTTAKRFLYHGQELLLTRDTPYGSLAVTREDQQMNFYENTTLLSSTNDVEGSEEGVHYALLQRPRPNRILLLSGGLSGAIVEILKYPIERIDYVELNPWLIDIGKRYVAVFSDSRINLVNADPRRFVRETTGLYDAVLINAPDPETAQINRYYTVEFFQLLKARLTTSAVVSLSLTSSADYQGQYARKVNGVIFNTLRSAFRHVVVVPGLRNYYLSSDDPLRLDMAALVEERGIKTVYVNKYYLNDALLRERSDALVRGLDVRTPLNADFTPIAYHRQLLYWLGSLQFDPWVPGVVIGLMVLVFLARLNAIQFCMFTGGFAGSSLEIVLLLSFQIIYGYVYQTTGLIITAFMAGLALGAACGQRRLAWIDMSVLTGIQCALAASGLALPWILSGVSAGIVGGPVIVGTFLLLILLIGLQVGMDFAVASRVLRGSNTTVASALYGVDLIGSAIGALAVSAYMVPLLGIGKVCMLVAGLNVVGAAVSVAARKRYSYA